MAIQSLETKIDSMVQDDQVNPVGVDSMAGALPETAAAPTDIVDQQTFEPYEVAGLGLGMVKQALKKAPAKTAAPILKAGEEVGKVGPYQVIKEATPKLAEDILQTAPSMPAAGKPSPTGPEIKAGVQATTTSLDNIIGPDELKQHIEATGRAYGADRLDKVSYKVIAAKAMDEGYDEAFIAKIINPLEETKANPKDAYKMLLTIVDAGKHAFDLGEQVKAAKAAGTLTPDLASEFQQAVAFEGVLMKAARGRQADIARTLGIFRTAREAGAQRGAMLESILTEAGGIESVHDLATKYTALDSRGGRAALSEKTIGGNVKDIWFSTWINGLLSSPVTHVKNIAGNLFFGAYQIPERAVASVIGTARNALFGGERAIQANEVYAQATGFLQGMREGGVIAGKAFVNNAPTDPFTKIEAARAGRDTFDIDMGDSMAGKAMSNALKYWGNFVTVPGRALMAEDEFFKAVGYRMELNSLATREANTMYANLVSKGIGADDAAKQAQDLMSSILIDTPADIESAARGMARTVTFTRELEPALQGLQSMAQNPLIKMFIPFVKTPTNIAMETMARTPGLNFASPRFWSDYNAGGIRQDMALARVTLGSGMIYAAGASALDGGLTGYGPMRNEDKKALEGTGWQQFSKVFNKSDISPDQIAEFQKITSVSIGPDKVYVSYAGLEPIASMMAIAATAAEYAQMGGDGSQMEKLMMGGALGIYEYMSEQPMLQGFSDMSKVFTSGSKDAAGVFYDLMQKSSKQVGMFVIGGSPIGAHSSMVGAVERIMDPTSVNTMPPGMGTRNSITEGAMRGFWEAVNYYKGRNPLTSDQLPRALDTITGETRKIGQGNLGEMFNPFKTSDGKMSLAHATLVEYGVPQHIPDKKMDGVALSATQYNRWIELATADGALEQAIIRIGKSKEMQRMAGFDLGAAQDVITSEISAAYSRGKQQLLLEDPDLADAIRNVKEAQRDEGKFKR